MNQCKDCIHEKICVIKAFPGVFENTKWTIKPCDHFRDGANEVTKSKLEEFAEDVKLVFYKEFDEIIPSIMADRIDELKKEYTEGEDTNVPTKVSSHEICVVCGEHVPEGRQICSMCRTGQEFLNKKKE